MSLKIVDNNFQELAVGLAQPNDTPAPCFGEPHETDPQGKPVPLMVGHHGRDGKANQPAGSGEGETTVDAGSRGSRKQKEAVKQRLWDLEQSSVYLNVSRSTMRRLAIQGIIPAVVIRSSAKNKSYRFRPEELDRFIVASERQHAREVKGGGN